MAIRDIYIAGKKASAGTEPIPDGWNSLHISSSSDSKAETTVRFYTDAEKTASKATDFILEAGAILDLQCKNAGFPVDIIVVSGGVINFIYSR